MVSLQNVHDIHSLIFKLYLSLPYQIFNFKCLSFLAAAKNGEVVRLREPYGVTINAVKLLDQSGREIASATRAATYNTTRQVHSSSLYTVKYLSKQFHF